MKRIFAVIFAALLVVSVFSGCNKQENDEITTDAEGSSASEAETSADGSNVNGEAGASDNGTEEGSAEASSGEQLTQSEDTSDVTETSSQKSDAADSSEATTASSDSASSQGSVSGAATNGEYDIVRSGNFYIKGYMVEGTGQKSPLEMAVTANSVYMLSEFSEGVDIGILVADGKMYMIYPNGNSYLEMSDAVMGMIGFDVEDIMGSKAVDFTSFRPLSEAYSVIDETFNGISCKVYSVKASDGEVKVYMSGERLIRFASYSSDGRFLSATEVDSISGTVPADRSAPPEGYKRYKGITGMFSFMTLLEEQA